VRPASPHEDAIGEAVEGLDFGSIEGEFRAQDRFVFVPRFLPPELVASMIVEARQFDARDVYRANVPLLRKAGAVGQAQIAERAPALRALYHSPSFLGFASRLAGTPLSLRHPDDAHAVSLYYYQRPGDFMAFHYDDCGCDSEASFTATFGLVHDTKARVQVQLFKREPARPMKELFVEMVPGSLLFFCGTRVYHRVTPLGKDEERITYSFSYVRGNRPSRGWRRLRENVSDAIFYFGPRALFQKNYG